MIPNQSVRDGVSILGLARSPTKAGQRKGEWIMFQYLGSRGAQLQAGCGFHRPLQVSILGLARSPTRRPFRQDWAIDVSILGLARSPTCL